MNERTNQVKAATLTQVALRAGVNKVTASIVLSGGQGNTRVSAATRQRIVQAAEELQYRPNALARSLRGGKTHIIGFYMGGFVDVRNNFLSQIISGLQQGCELNRHDFLVHGTFRGPSIDDIYAELMNGKVDGLVVLTGKQPNLVDKLVASHLPIIVVSDPHPGLPSVTVDNAHGSQMLAERLASKGHRHVLYGVCPYNLSSTVRRYDAFLAAARELDIQVTPRTGRSDDGTASEVELDYLSWSKTDSERPTAIVCWHDEMAHGVINSMHGKGLSVPDDVAVVGFDGWDSTIKPSYQLTTIRAPWREVARTAVDLLVQNTGKPVEADTILPVELIPGNTV